MSQPYILVIPSHKRAKTLFNKTYTLLKKTNAIEPIIWLNDNDDIEEYKKYIPNGIYKIGGTSIKEKRILIQEEYPLETKIVMIDDDIKNIIVYNKENPKQKRYLVDFNNLVDLAFKEAENQNCSLWGCYPIDNPFFMKSSYRTNLCYIIASLCGVINKRIPTETNYAEDFERSILHYNLDKKVLRLEFIGLSTNYYKEPGGLQETRTEQKNYNDKKYLADKYPTLCDLVEKNNRAEIRFKRSRAQLISIDVPDNI